MCFKKEKQICVLNLDGHFLTLRHFERPRNGRQPQLAVEPSVLETRSQEEVIAFFLVIGMRYLTFVFPSSYHSQRLFVITSGIDEPFFIFVVCPAGGSGVLNKNFRY